MSRRIPDAQKAGKSSLVPFKPGEQPAKRHQRRLRVNSKHFGKMQAWCDEHGYTLKVSNKGQHWQVSDEELIAEWWPSSAKLVINKHWSNGIHCHDYKQVQREIQRRARG